MRKTALLALVLALAAAPVVQAQEVQVDTAEPVAAEPAPRDRPETVARGLAWLAKNQQEDGSWKANHAYAVSGLACLALLAGRDDPFAGERGQPLLLGLRYLLGQQKEGVFEKQGHTWIHGQGFATLALAEAYGRARRSEEQPDLDLPALREAVEKAVRVIEESQSTSGGWWYTRGAPNQHEGSTTVCAVQALVAARNAGLEVSQEVLDKGFEYLKKCQNPDGGFDYMLGPGTASMKEGTAGGIATLSLMKRFDYAVMVDGTKFLKTAGHETISKERFPYYGHFYGCMGMRLFGEEMGAERDVAPYIDGAQATLIAWQTADGSWPVRGWMSSQDASVAYSTAFAALTLSIPETRLSVFLRNPPPPR